jgi:hypothetical protein
MKSHCENLKEAKDMTINFASRFFGQDVKLIWVEGFYYKIVPASSALKKIDDKVGGIDLKTVDVRADAASSALKLAPFDVTKFNGFTFKVVNIRKADRATVLAMAQ